MIYIFGSARSGSTWLAKIFDSHPDVLYLHEPELFDRGLDILPLWLDSEPQPRHVAAAKTYLTRLLATRSSRITGARPFFRKHYRSTGAEQLRRTLIYAAKGVERVGVARYVNRLHIPDLADRSRPMMTVIKSVSALGRAEVLIKAAEGTIRPILLIRHPCGYVSSMLRGTRIGTMKPLGELGRLQETHAAQRLGIEPGALESADCVEKLAWNWLLSNAEAYPAIRAAGGETVVYETLTRDPKTGVIELFRKIGLSWTPETEAFLDRSVSRDGGYYSVYRDPVKAAGRWRQELGEETVAKVRAIVTRDPVGQSFFDS